MALVDRAAAAGQRLLLGPRGELVGVDLGLAVLGQCVMDVGEQDVVGVFDVDLAQQLLQVVAVDVDIEARHALGQLGYQIADHAHGLALGVPKAGVFLPALALEP